jgi:hypothetical protein
MPYMTREQIVSKYGFDPGADENQSIYVKNSELEEDKNLAPSEIRLPPTPRHKWTEPEEYAPHNTETPTADPGRMMVSGAVRGWISEPFKLAGLAVAAFNAASGKITGSEESLSEGFKKGLYKEGGIEAVQNHLREKQQELYKQHPDWDSDQIHHAMLEYQATKPFFEFNTDQMSLTFGTGMKMAARSNGWFGVAKTPEQETWMDEAAQMVGQVITPSFGIFNRGVSLATRALGLSTPRAAELFARAADAIVLPGTGRGHYTPGGLATGIGAGMAVDEGVRTLTGEPTALSGEAFTARDPVVGGPTAAPDAQSLGARLSDYLLPGAGAVVGAGALVRALRGRARLNPNVIEGGPTRREQIDAERARTGFEPIREDPLLDQQPLTIERMSTAINEYEPVERLARDVARRAEQQAAAAGQAPHVARNDLEVDVQAAHGLDMSKTARDEAFQIARTDGLFPDRTRAEVTIKNLENRAQAANPESVDRFSQAVTAMNVADMRLRGVQDLMGQYRANPNDPVVMRSLSGRLADTPESRAQFSAWSDRDIGNRVRDAMGDPEAHELLQMFADINRSINRYELNAGMITHEQFLARHATPYHVPLFEFGGGPYDPAMPRGTIVDPNNPGIRVNTNADPFSAINLSMGRAIDDGKVNAGKGRVINALMAADTNGEFIRLQPGPPDANSVVHRVNGRDVVYEFSRPSVANALNAQPLTLGPVAQIGNNLRQWFHYLTTGPILGGIPTAVNSALYDVTAAYTTSRPGRSFGYASTWARAINASLGDNRYAHHLIDTARAFDPTAPVQTAVSVPIMTFWKTSAAVGRSMMEAAISRSGLFEAIARTPGGRQWLLGAGSYINQAVDRSLFGVMKHANILPAHQMMTDTFATKGKFEGLVKEYMNASRDLTFKQAFHNAITPWTALIDNLHNSAKYAYFSSNYTVLEHRYPRGIPQVEIDRLAEETRRMSGDIQAHGGSPLYNSVMATTPYGNIAIQAHRHLLHAAFAQGSKQSFDVGLRLAMLGMTAYAGMNYVAALGKDAIDWYWNGLNEWERVGTVPIPTPSAIITKLTTGQYPTFDRTKPFEHFMTIGSHMPRIAAEVVPLYQIALAAFEYAGLINRGTNTARGTAMQDIGSSVANALNVGSNLVLNTALATQGMKADFLSPLRGRSTVSQAHAPKGENGRTPGGIDIRAVEVGKALFGLGMDALIRATDAGLQTLQRGQSFANALSRAGLEARTAIVDERYPSIPGLWKAEPKVYSSNAEGQRIKGMERVEKEVRQTWQTEFGKGRMTLPEAGRVQDRDVQYAIYAAHEFFDKGPYRKMMEYRSMVEQARDNLEAQKDRYTPAQIAEKRRKYEVDLRGIQSQMIPVIEIFEKTMATGRTGAVFQRHGLEPRLENVPALIEAYKRKAPRS